MQTTHVFRFKHRDWTLYRRGTGRREPAAGTPWSFRLTVGGKRVLISTRTAHLETALRTAKARIEAVMGGRVDALSVDRAQTGRGKLPTLAEVSEVYLRAKVVREATSRKNIASLIRILRTVMEVSDVDGVKIDVLSETTAAKWLAKRQGLEHPDYGQILKANAGANSALRQAQMVFAKRHRHIWKEWRIPEGVAAFAGAKRLKEAPSRYVPLPEKALTAMDKAAATLKASDPELWIVNRSIRLMGLRDSEVAAMRTSWLVEHGGRLFLDVVARPGEFVPKGHQGRVMVPSVLEAEFRHRLAEDPEGFLVRAKTKTDRFDLIYRTHSKWLRAFLPAGRQKTNHELRKHAGSLVAMKFNSWEAAARFLREDLETAKKHYLELLQPVGLEIEDLTYESGPAKRVVAKR